MWIIELRWLKAHAGNKGNEMADQLAKAAARDSDAETVFNRIPMDTMVRDKRKNGTTVARGMERVYKGTNNKGILSNSARQAKVKNKGNPNRHSDSDGPRQDKGLPPPLQNSRGSNLPLR